MIPELALHKDPFLGQLNQVQEMQTNCKVQNKSPVIRETETEKKFFFPLAFSRAAPVAYGGSQARGLIRAGATDLHQSHSNAKSLTH